MNKTILLAASSALLGLGIATAETDCIQLSRSVKAAVANEPAKVLKIVEENMASAPGCACEVVKAAIEGSAADAKTVAAIVETAIMAAPDQMRLISQCAIAVAPDALAAVQAVLAKLDPNSGEVASSAKGAKAPAGEVASMPNPLDFPGRGPIGPLFPVFPPIIINPPVIDPQEVSPNEAPPF
jgi:hypothetical protein